MADELSSTQLGRRLGAELTHLRRMAKVGGRRMAAATGLSQSSVSRIESGRRRPSRTEVDVWLATTGASDDSADRVLALLKAVHAETMHWRDLLVDTGTLQDQVAEREHAARRIFDWSPEEIPGLLQTRQYVEALMPLVGAPGVDHAATVAGRLQRQRILYEPGREFVMLTTEYALYRPAAPASVMDDQRAHLVRQSKLDGVTIGIVPEPYPLLAASGFVFYDGVTDGDPFVALELTHGPMVLSDPEDVGHYRAVSEQLLDRSRSIEDLA